MKIHKVSTLGCVVFLLSGGAAFADACSGRDHTTGTVVGALGGAAIGGAASHNAGGAVAGAVVGGLAGNAIARAQDCNRADYRGDRGDYRDRGYQGGASVSLYGGPQEDRYWSVQSYDGFNENYRHIWAQIRRGREEGTLSRGDAERYMARLRHIRERADYQQRSGRFDPAYTEVQLRDLRRSIRYARREGGDDRSYRRDDAPYRR